jgi:hypothetical protein
LEARRSISVGLVVAACSGGFGPNSEGANTFVTAGDDGGTSTVTGGTGDGETGDGDGASSQGPGPNDDDATGPESGDGVGDVSSTSAGSEGGTTSADSEGGMTSADSEGGGCVPQAEACDLDDDDCNGVIDDVGGCRVWVHRSVHPQSGEHFYTTDLGEAQCCGYQLENDEYFSLYAASHPGLAAFHRCIIDNGFHFYTTDPGCEGGQLEGTLGHIATSELAGTTALHRAWYPVNNDHLFTIDAQELANAVAGGWVDEGTVGWVWTQ